MEGDPSNLGRVEPGWAATLATVVDGEEKFRGNVWAGVAKALAGLDLWEVRRRFDPAAGEQFDPAGFVAGRGTLYLLAKEDDPASRLLQCLVDDIVRVGKAVADRSPNARLDPPLTLVLDEIANFAPLPALPSYVSAYGGSGIVTMVFIQGRSQMARTWGSDAAKAIWDAATITGVLGGVTSAEDLRDFAAIAGQRDELSWHGSTGKSIGAFGGGDGRSYSEHVTQRAVLDEGEIRGLPEGTMLMFYKGLDPMLVQMTAYYRRQDAKALAAGRREVQQAMASAGTFPELAAGPSASAVMNISDHEDSIRSPRLGSVWSASRSGRRQKYQDYLAGTVWSARKRWWRREYLKRNDSEPTCVVCGSRRIDLHHLEHRRVGAERFEDLLPLCRLHHRAVHAAWDVSPQWRRLGRRVATLAMVQLMRTNLDDR